MSFQAIPGNIPELEPEILKDLSTDQEILYRLAVGVTSGNVPSELSARKLGPLNMAMADVGGSYFASIRLDRPA